MLNVHEYLVIRTAQAGGESKRSIFRRLRRSEQTVRQVIAWETGKPEPYRRAKPAGYPKRGKFLGAIDTILEEDRKAPLKQRHTSMQIFPRLTREHQYEGKYDPVRRYVKKKRRKERQTLIPLQHEPGQRIECDFGEVAVYSADGRPTVPDAVMSRLFTRRSPLRLLTVAARTGLQPKRALRLREANSPLKHSFSLHTASRTRNRVFERI